MLWNLPAWYGPVCVPTRPHQPFARVLRALKHRGAGMIGRCHIVEHLPSLTEWRMVDVMEIERE